MEIIGMPSSWRCANRDGINVSGQINGGMWNREMHWVPKNRYVLFTPAPALETRALSNKKTSPSGLHRWYVRKMKVELFENNLDIIQFFQGLSLITCFNRFFSPISPETMHDLEHICITILARSLLACASITSSIPIPITYKLANLHGYLARRQIGSFIPA